MIIRAALTVTLLLAVGSAFAQQTQPETPEEALVTRPVEPSAPYDPKLLRLSEVLGSIHYLRTLCKANEGTKWRDTMSSIVAAETPGPKKRARMIARFNRGYRAFDSVYTRCTPSALLATERYMKEGAKLSGQIVSRYGR